MHGDAATRGISASLFGMIMLCFLLPFISVSCAGDGSGSAHQGTRTMRTVAVARGWQVAAGAAPDRPGGAQPTSGAGFRDAGAQLLATSAIAAAAVGMIVCVRRRRPWAAAARLGATGTVLVLVGQAYDDHAVVAWFIGQNGAGRPSEASVREALTTRPEIGFWAALALLIIVTLLNSYRMHLREAPAPGRDALDPRGDMGARGGRAPLIIVCGVGIASTVGWAWWTFANHLISRGDLAYVWGVQGLTVLVPLLVVWLMAEALRVRMRTVAPLLAIAICMALSLGGWELAVATGHLGASGGLA